jgi:hypothetical protein
MAALPTAAFRKPPQFGYYQVLHQLGDPRVS